MRTLVALAGALAIATVLVGCAGEEPRQAGARVAVQEHVAAAEGYRVKDTHCTDSASTWFVKKDTQVFICAVRRTEGGCDWYRATLQNAGWDVVLDTRDAGCVLPL